MRPLRLPEVPGPLVRAISSVSSDCRPLPTNRRRARRELHWFRGSPGAGQSPPSKGRRAALTTEPAGDGALHSPPERRVPDDAEGGRDQPTIRFDTSCRKVA